MNPDLDYTHFCTPCLKFGVRNEVWEDGDLCDYHANEASLLATVPSGPPRPGTDLIGEFMAREAAA